MNNVLELQNHHVISPTADNESFDIMHHSHFSRMSDNQENHIIGMNEVCSDFTQIFLTERSANRDDSTMRLLLALKEYRSMKSTHDRYQLSSEVQIERKSKKCK
jgi:hypothetical protein